MNNEIFTAEEAKTHHFSAALYKAAREFFIPAEPVLDFGCGDGRYLRCFAEDDKGLRALMGVEGTHEMTHQDYALNKSVGKKTRGGQMMLVQWDLRNPIWLGMKGNVMCVEVAEHIDWQYHDVLMDTLSRHCNGRLLLSWATRGQGGLRHISERDEAEVLPYLARWGFQFKPEESLKARAAAGAEFGYFARSIYLFARG